MHTQQEKAKSWQCQPPAQRLTGKGSIREMSKKDDMGVREVGFASRVGHIEIYMEIPSNEDPVETYIYVD